MRQQLSDGSLEHLAYRPDIDGLRAIAVLGVVIFHAFPDWLPGGFAGVDVFFVISGYLITALILQDFGRGGFSLKAFYARRIRRIFPSLLAMLAVVWCLGYLLLMPGELRALGQSMVHSAYFANNFLLYGQAGYFDTEAELKPLLHLWSLSVEEQFYIVWPWMLWLAVRMRRYGRWIPLVLTLPSLVACVMVTAERPIAAFFLPQFRGWELLFGAMAAAYGGLMRNRLAEVLGRGEQGIAWLGLGMIAGAYVYVDGTQPYPGWRALLPVVGAFLVILGRPDAWGARRLLGCRAAVAIGLISYPLYLWHWPLFSFARILFGTPSPYLFVSLIGVAFILALASYRFLETPIRRSGSLIQGAVWIPVFGVVLLLVLGGVGDWTRAANGFPSRIAGETWQSLEWKETQILDLDCAAKLLPQGSYCQWNAASAVSHVLLGDSHANHFFPGLAGVVEEHGGNLVQLEAPLALSDDARWGNVEWAVGLNSVKMVFVAFHQGRIGQRDNPFSGALAEMVARIMQAEKKVVLLVDNPEFDFDPRQCSERPWVAKWLGAGRRVEEACVESAAYILRKRDGYTKALKVLHDKYPDIVYIDTVRPFCDETHCSPIHANTLLFRDRHHLSVQGSMRAFSHSPELRLLLQGVN